MCGTQLRKQLHFHDTGPGAKPARLCALSHSFCTGRPVKISVKDNWNSNAIGAIGDEPMDNDARFGTSDHKKNGVVTNSLKQTHAANATKNPNTRKSGLHLIMSAARGMVSALNRDPKIGGSGLCSVSYEGFSYL